jgi:AcrR family transcriptional regulator
MKLKQANETKQGRSQRTLEKILEAAEKLLQERDFDELTMAELAEHAGCAVGTLYGRIPNKDSLLACLYERLDRQIQTQAGEMFGAVAGLGLAERVAAVCGIAVDFLSATRGVNRAVTLHLWSRSEDEFGFRRSTTASFKQAAAFLAECKDEIAHKNAREACEFGLMTVSTMAQDRIVFGDRSGIQLRYSARALKRRLTSLLLGYLRTPA